MKNLKKIVSGLLCMALTLSLISFPVQAEGYIAELSVADEFGDYVIQVTENGNQRITYLKNENTNEIEMKLYFDKNTLVLSNPDNNVSIAATDFVDVQLSPCRENAQSRTEYKYTFCTLGTVQNHYSFEKVTDILNIITVTITSIAIATALIALIGIGFVGAGRTALSNLASDIKDAYDHYNGTSTFAHYYAYLSWKTSCEEVYESDPNEPGGGFWFLGYMPVYSYFYGYVFYADE